MPKLHIAVKNSEAQEIDFLSTYVLERNPLLMDYIITHYQPCMFEQCFSSCLNIHNFERYFSISSRNTGSKSKEPKLCCFVCNTLALFYCSLLLSIEHIIN